ncbi:MAG: hypothetical protein OEO83_18205, partial [Alphaproteobacteria bacterium]|nr:hypothetical protein [Alphaproteobacteria bacterium]
LSVQWFAVPGLSVTPRLSAFHRNADPGVTDDYVRAGVDVRWSWRRLAADLRYDHTDRNTDTTGYVEDRVFFEVRRKF